MAELFYFEDIQIGQRDIGETIIVDGAGMLAFAQIWDPVPIHVNEAVAEKVMGGLTAPGIYILALKQRLIHQMKRQPAVIGSVGYDEVRFFQPVRAGDQLTLVIDWIDKRASKSKPDRGIVTHRLSLLDQQEQAVMSHLDTLLVSRRPPV